MGVPTLLGKLRAEPDAFEGKPVRVLAYRNEGVSNQARAAFDRAARSTYSPEQAAGHGGINPFHETDTDWRPEPGTVLIEFHFARRGGKPRFGQIWRVRGKDAFVPVGGDDEPGWHLVLCDRRLDVDGLRLPSDEQEELGRMVRDYIGRRELWEEDTERNHDHLLDMPLHEFWAAHIAALSGGATRLRRPGAVRARLPGDEHPRAPSNTASSARRSRSG